MENCFELDDPFANLLGIDFAIPDIKRDELENSKENHQNFLNHKACTVGLDRRADEVICLLNSISDDQKEIVAIRGVSGIGKSTLAHKVHHYFSKQFLHNHIVDKAGDYIKNHGLENFVSYLARNNSFDVKQNKLFLTLKDVDDSESLEAVIQLPDLLGRGSKIVITSKDDHLLEKLGIERIYIVERFNNLETYKLLALKALGSECIHVSYVSVIKRAAPFAFGLPLLAEVIGSNLDGKQKKECELILAEYEEIRGEETEEIPMIKRILRTSFNALEECCQKKLIYIANLLLENKYFKEEVECNLRSVFTGCPKQDMKALLDKSLMKINEDGEVIIHELIQDMIREICIHEEDVSDENMV